MIVAAIGAGLLAGSCLPQKACTEIGCVDGVQVRFSQPIRQPGTYRFQIQMEGVASTCIATLPMPACDRVPAPCDSLDLLLGLSGCALAADQHAIVSLDIRTSPRKLDVTVTRDDAAFASGNYDVTYRRVAPNGEECGPICNQAAVELAIP